MGRYGERLGEMGRGWERCLEEQLAKPLPVHVNEPRLEERLGRLEPLRTHLGTRTHLLSPPPTPAHPAQPRVRGAARHFSDTTPYRRARRGGCLGGVSEVSRRCLGRVSEVSRKCGPRLDDAPVGESVRLHHGGRLEGKLLLQLEVVPHVAHLPLVKRNSRARDAAHTGHTRQAADTGEARSAAPAPSSPAPSRSLRIG